ncbi:MAG: histidine kinase [Pseudomonadota bacterium]
MQKILETLWLEPRAASATGPHWRDWLLVTLVVGLALVENFTRDVIVWRSLSVGLSIVLMLTLPWRRTQPLWMVILAFGTNTAAQVTAMMLNVEWNGLFVTAFLLILPYALLRWASGREVFAGLAFLGLTFILTIGLANTPLNEMVAAALFLFFPAAIGASVRYRDSAAQRAREQVRLRERERLARELHDTVAHHVSAIAIQAQAGQAQAASDPAAPLQALRIIEDAASKTLREMRHIVRSMRDNEEATLAPATSLADIEQLVLQGNYPIAVALNIEGDIEGEIEGETQALDASLSATLYRLTQESITNAVRHAQDASRLDINIISRNDQIQLVATDDGKATTKPRTPGLGLQGMAERVALLGGQLSAGPGTRGWTVTATLPRSGKTA